MNKLIAFAVVLTMVMGCNAAPEREVYIQLYSVRDVIKTDLSGTIQQLALMGYKGVEAAGYADGKFYGLSPDEFMKQVNKTGMKVVSSHASRPLSDIPSQTNWAETWAWWDIAIAAHKSAGMKTIVIPWMPMPQTLADLKAYCDYYNKIGERCNAAGLKLGYHNHAFEFAKVEGEIMYDYMLRNTDPSKLFFQMDVYWVIEGGKNPVDYFSAYPGRFRQLHLKDEKELGKSGKVDFKSILAAQKQAGVKELIVEVEKYSMQALESVKVSLEYLNEVLKK
jgi:sugar phosphate isomerase/epimerase